MTDREYITRVTAYKRRIREQEIKELVVLTSLTATLVIALTALLRNDRHHKIV